MSPVPALTYAELVRRMARERPGGGGGGFQLPLPPPPAAGSAHSTAGAQPSSPDTTKEGNVGQDGVDAGAMPVKPMLE